MIATTGILTPGFASPVHDAQRVFRAVLDAMARPTTPQHLEIVLTPPAPLSRETGAVVLALCDEQTPIWLDDALRQRGDVEAWIRFHTGARIVDEAGEALFCVASSPSAVPMFDALETGTDEEPHLSATVIVDATDARAVGSFLATGPGIEGSREWDGSGLSARNIASRHAQEGLFPRGVDVILASCCTIRALPRTTILAEREAN